MTRTEVEAAIARLSGCVREKQISCGGCAGCGIALDDLEALRQHDEAQAAELAAANNRFDKRIAELILECSRIVRQRDRAEQLLLDTNAIGVGVTKLIAEIEERRAR